MSKKTVGVCKLTGRSGEFVKAHIFPRALTRPEIPGNFFVGSTDGGRPGRQWSSWYDNRLVILRGERILASLDDWAIKYLREKKLVWSGWDAAELEASDHQKFAHTGHGIRIFEDIDSERLRLFFLSILWRSAASTLSDFKAVELRAEDLTQLSRMLIENDSGSASYFPIQLVQLSTKGPTHNMGPLIRTTVLPPSEGHPEYRVRHFRFYFDGLVMHIHVPPFDDRATKSLGGLVLGGHERFGVVTVKSEASFQIEAFNHDMFVMQRDWPDDVKKLVATARRPAGG